MDCVRNASPAPLTLVCPSTSRSLPVAPLRPGAHNAHTHTQACPHGRPRHTHDCIASRRAVPFPQHLEYRAHGLRLASLRQARLLPRPPVEIDVHPSVAAMAHACLVGKLKSSLFHVYHSHASSRSRANPPPPRSHFTPTLASNSLVRCRFAPPEKCAAMTPHI